MFKVIKSFSFLFVILFVVAAINAQNERRPQVFEREIVMEGPSGSFLGVQTVDVNKENFAKFGLSGVRGVAVEKVLPDSPAKAGMLQDGDVIIRFNGEEVTGYRKLTRLISETAPDHQAKITVLRGGAEKELTVTMGKQPKMQMGSFEMSLPRVMEAPLMLERRPMPGPGGPLVRGMPLVMGLPRGGAENDNEVFLWESDGDSAQFVFGSSRQIGVGMSNLTKQLGEYFGVADGKGVLVSGVEANSPAAKVGMKAGDVIVEINGKAISNPIEMVRAIDEKKEGEISVTFIRDKNRQTVKVTPEKSKAMEFKADGPARGTVRVVTSPGAAPRKPGNPE